MSGNEIPDNQVWYTSSDGNIIDIIAVPEYGVTTAEYGLGSVVISNQYYDKGIIKTSGPVTQIGQAAFHDKTSLVSITLPRQVAVICGSAFDGCTSLSQIDLKNITSIESQAFSSCTSLASVTIPDSVTSIGDGAFHECTSLTSVIIGNSVTSIGDMAFEDCKSLTSVYCKPTTPPTAGSWMFHSTPSGRKIYVPMESVEAYKAASGWSDHASYIEGYDF